MISTGLKQTLTSDFTPQDPKLAKDRTMLILSTDKSPIQVIYGTKPHKNPLVKPVNGNSATQYCGLSHKYVDN